ncbi:solute carrier family 22 member 6-like [Haliotis rubra]|uniref:solute carrier family 22 member 6-like n=1 Tax=Haliotis rubra TaxID=36100 RepID=UPI001EE5E834|nr:solute carrier family 22 member 6-like [Haliotis rubra]
MTSKEEVNFDSVFNALGWNGRYQIVQVGLVLLSSLPFAFHIMSIIFIGSHVPSQCKELNDTSVVKDLVCHADLSDFNITYHECGISITSNKADSGDRIELSCIEGYRYEKPRELSLVSEWDVVCEKEGLSDLLQTLYMFGTGIGAILFTVVADRFGRKFSNVVAGVSFLVVGTGMAFIPTFVPFAVLRVLQGATQMVGYIVCAATQIGREGDPQG